MLERFESQLPIISHGAVDKNESVFVISNQRTISKQYVNVNNVKVMGQRPVNCFAS